jgi:hypothetical protein
VTLQLYDSLATSLEHLHEERQRKHDKDAAVRTFIAISWPSITTFLPAEHRVLWLPRGYRYNAEGNLTKLPSRLDIQLLLLRCIVIIVAVALLQLPFVFFGVVPPYFVTVYRQKSRHVDPPTQYEIRGALRCIRTKATNVLLAHIEQFLL